MTGGRLRRRKALALPLHEGAVGRVEHLTVEYSEALVSQARLVAHRGGAMQVSALHVERSYHMLQLAPRPGGREIGKLVSGLLFGAGSTMVSVGLQAEPVIVSLTVVGITACVGGALLIAWVGATTRTL